jgi:hypothetical protein
MRNHRALEKTWVRALLLVPTTLILFAGLFVLSGILTEDESPLGDPVSYLDWGILLVAVFFGPAWVLHALPTPPRNDGPPRGGIVPLPTRKPGAGTLDLVEDRADKAARLGLQPSG